jgi:hypothetical protein
MKAFTLFDEHSTSEISKPFYVSQDWYVELIGFNFPSYKTQPDPDKAKVRALACVHRILFKEFQFPEFENEVCGVIPDLSIFKPEILIEGPIVVNDCPWHISNCNNFALLDIPGCYRLVLNTPSVVGLVSVHMIPHPKLAFARTSGLYFGEK